MDLVINPTQRLNGTITAPGSKSYSHRAFIIASFAEGVSVIRNPLTSGDVSVTMNVLKTLGINITQASSDKTIVKRKEKSYDSVDQIIDCGNSGTSIRIFSALALLVPGGLSFEGEFLKRKRPIIDLLESLKYVGGEYELSENILKVRRTTQKCDTIRIRGEVSSQFITALLILSTKLSCKQKDYMDIEITTPLVSYPYVRITLDVLKSFGITIIEQLDNQRKGMYSIQCNQQVRPQFYDVPGDFSSAAFMIAAAALAPEESKVVINNLDLESIQGDKRIIDILQDMGANIETLSNEKQVIIYGHRSKLPLKGVEIDCLESPDLFPILSVVGAIAKGKTVLYNVKNIRMKESDRVAVMARELTKMGVKVEEEEDRLIVYHCEQLSASTIDHENDHRIAMACCVAALYADSPGIIKNIEIANDSYPTFIHHLKLLGANINNNKGE
ncbi:MAG: 3-phosphoshikimate 1-carboxyvinyltransferase [Promethearchaeota archaeon]